MRNRKQLSVNGKGRGASAHRGCVSAGAARERAAEDAVHQMPRSLDSTRELTQICEPLLRESHGTKVVKGRQNHRSLAFVIATTGESECDSTQPFKNIFFDQSIQSKGGEVLFFGESSFSGSQREVW